ncbi:tetratricopeptide repeat protein [Nocardioides sp. ChNu-153]|uniref:tetratricopeptide repeat protein n=1 Tax=unclassified Nocardioides TaxID=2615069 RepID=UPI002405D5ED|nr:MULTISPECIES: tetratricopeptide repeat protein [unclassified Nocardioides]MDF9717040.1 tetratricopeptide repeat protein [Nocardioides sp. ChNu-99]MDN7122248.1 tetratricopeptide repeat protein [Nocardioides sp. ChNu-153]
MSAPDDLDPLERDVDLAWELYDVQPTHPEIGRLAGRVLAQQPDRTGIRMLLALHLEARDDIAEARRILLDVVGRRDRFFVDAARRLRALEQHECDHAEARRWAEVVLQEEPDGWHDRMELGASTAMAGDPVRGWRLLDEAVAHCARTDADDLRHALASRALSLFQSFAPPERFVPAAEEAMRADPSSEIVGGPLIWAYVHQGRFDEAEELASRLLRLDPTDGLAGGALQMIRDTRAAAEKHEMTLADVHAAGLVAAAWSHMRAQVLGTDLASALAALETVLPPDLRAALRPPLDEEAARSLSGEREIATWHDGQEPGTGALWGPAGGGFRLLSGAEVTAMDEAIEAEPDAWPEWPQDSLEDYYSQVMTDDAGGYLVATLGDVVVRRTGADDVHVAPSLADWFWDRVSDLGGRDPRPRVQDDDDAGGTT